MKTVAIIQARMSSQRLPGKVLLPLVGKTVLGRVISRVKMCPLVNETMVATTDRPEDDPIVAEAEKNGASYFRGDLDDVLLRYYGAARASRADTIVRVTSDCPLFDPQVLAEMLTLFYARKKEGPGDDFLSNTLTRSYPRGLDAEIFTFAALEKSAKSATKIFEREHVTPYIYQHPDQFQLYKHVVEPDLSFHRWTLDTPEDYRLINGIFTALADKEKFLMQDVLALFEQHPAWLQINADIEQKKLK